MKKEVGLWIDRRKTVIVTIENDQEITREIRSNIENHVRPTAKNRVKSTKKTAETSANELQEKNFGDNLRNYYTGVISMIRSADSIWIIGPGEAKGELEHMLQKEGLGERIVGIETVNKMTDPQIQAKVRVHYQAY
ncbi:MAG: hypothetical protein CVU46_08045 [Chloroflexi bacterium HGW-Chloroflexi-8]|jgi:hypothetical protein|nr:MAG: hypothetical protein CVU46_08045 [Chloroflexi bacterium HGW-Chloroflexi-8]